MFRIPHHREITGLFIGPNTVAGATKVLSDTAARLDDVSSHHCRHADRKAMRSADHRIKAKALDDEVAGHQKEAGRAAKIASNLEALLA